MEKGTISHEEFVKGVKKQQSLIRKLIASRERRNECLAELAFQRYGWMIGKYFNTGDKKMQSIPEKCFCYVTGIAASADGMNDDVTIGIKCRVFKVIGDKGFTANLIDSATLLYNVNEDLEAEFHDKWVSPQNVAELLSDVWKKFIKKFGM